MVPLTKAIAEYHTGTLHHATLKNRDGTPVRARITGMIKTWKTRPNDYRLPVKHGMYHSFYITPENEHEWQVTNDDFTRAVQRKHRSELVQKLGVSHTIPDAALHDMAEEAGHDPKSIRYLLGNRRRVVGNRYGRAR